jgi:hypothetical protein
MLLFSFTVNFTHYRVVSVNIMIISSYHTIIKGHVVVQLVEALCYKPEGHGFDS